MIPINLRQALKVSVSAHFIFIFATIAVTADHAPFSIQNRFPLHFMFLSARPVGAQLPPAGSVRTVAAFEYGSVYMDEANERWQLLMDMEIAVFDFSLLYGITHDIAIRLDVPLVSMSGGFMDGFLENFHSALGLPNYGREDRPENDYAYQIRKDDELWIEGSSGNFLLGDLTLTAHWALSRSLFDTDWQSTLLTSIKLPTGDSDKAMGSGNVDFGLFFPLQRQNKLWTFHLMPGFTHHGDPDSLGATVSAQDSFSVFAGAAYAYSERLSWIGQLSYFSTPIERTGIGKIDDGAYSLTLGFRRRINPQWGIELAFTEDIFTRATPDFMLHLGVLWCYDKESP